MAFRWDGCQLRVDDSDPIGFPIVDIEPIKRVGLSNTLDVLQRKGLAFDCSLWSRFEQPVTGLASYHDDSVISVWTCTAAGDVFEQKIALGHQDNDPPSADIEWVDKWARSAREIEAQFPCCPVDSTDLIDFSEAQRGEAFFLEDFYLFFF